MITASNNQGLGNRLKCLVNAIRFAEYYGTHLNNRIELDKFLDVEPKLVTNDSGYNKNISTWRIDLLPTEINSMFGPEHSSLILHDDLTGKMWNRKDLQNYPSDGTSNDWLNKVIDFEYDNIPLSIRNNIVSTFAKIKFKDYIVSKVNSIPNDYTIGVHIRTWPKTTKYMLTDNDVTAYYRNINLKSIDRLIDIIKSLPNEIFLICTDDYDSVKNALTGINNVRFYTEYIHTNETWFNVVVDLLSISKADKLLLSYYSTLSECAWYLNGCKPAKII